MSKKSTVSTALWFIPLLAIVLALAFVFIYWVGRTLLRRTETSVFKPSVSATVPQVQPQNAPSPIIPPYSMQEEEESEVPQEVLELEQLQQGNSTQPESEVCPATTVAVKIQKPKRKVSYTSYQKGLRQCLQNNMFPCAWEDRSDNTIKQYWLMSSQGPITRGIYDLNGNLQQETIASVNGTVSTHTDQNVTWYFESGVLVKIRTSPYDNCNFHDWFFINEAGEQDVCQCAYTTQDCCARSPYKSNIDRSYCALFPQDKDFCK